MPISRNAIYNYTTNHGAEMTEFLGFAIFAIGGGAAIVIQAAINSNLRFSLDSAMGAGFVSYLGGTLFMLVGLLVTRQSWPAAATIARVDWLSWTGGFFGAIYVIAAIWLLPRLGATTLLALFVTGQMLASVIMDHYGILGVPQHPADWPRLIGCSLLIVGVVLIRV